MRVAAISCFVMGASILAAQEPSATIVRAIVVRQAKPVGTCSNPLPQISPSDFLSNLHGQGIDLEVEHKFDPTSVDKAADVLKKMYSANGQQVSIEHTVSLKPPRSTEVAFMVSQVCR
jgi:hypothetical protein